MAETKATGMDDNSMEQVPDPDQMFAALKAAREAWAEKETIGERFLLPREGKKPVQTILYRPGKAAGTGNLPVFVNMHGGAWIGGDAVLMETFCQLLADRLPAFVVNVNYTKADEEPLPYAHEEVADTVLYFAAHSKEYGIDPAKIIVGGHSAGANLAAGAALMLRDEGFPLFAQVLVYVAADLTNRDDDELKGLMQLLFPDGGQENPVISPGALPPEKLSGLAPALFVICGKDSLRPGCISYAGKLMEAAVPVKTKEYPDAEHGFLEVNRPDYEQEDPRKTEEQARYARDCEDWIVRELKAML